MHLNCTSAGSSTVPMALPSGLSGCVDLGLKVTPSTLAEQSLCSKFQVFESFVRFSMLSCHNYQHRTAFVLLYEL